MGSLLFILRAGREAGWGEKVAMLVFGHLLTRSNFLLWYSVIALAMGLSKLNGNRRNGCQ